MNNVFDIIKNYIKSNDTPMYGDLISDNKNDNSIRRMCSSEDYENYKMINNLDKRRLILENNTGLQQSNTSINRQQEVVIPGIGKVKQIC